MRLPIALRDIAPRLATGGFILHSGIEKTKANAETVQGVHGFASGTYPFLKDIEPATFVKLLAAGEIAIGTALLLPVVPTAVAGAALTAFSAGLLGLYARTPGMRKEGSIWPTQQGLPISKDVWMLGVGLGFVTEGLLGRGRR